MNGEIIDEEDEWVGVRVTDNNGEVHKIAVKKAGGIQGHSQDGYPDKAAERTDEGNERVEQARRFARYYVYQQRGYDTVPAPENPVRINAVRHAIQQIDPDEFARHFSDLRQQLQHEHDGSEPPTMDVPSAATDPAIFSQNVYLGIDPLETDVGQQLATEYGLDVTDEGAGGVDLTEVSESEARQWGEFSGEFSARAIQEGITLDEAIYIDDTSKVYVQYPSGPDIVAADDHLADTGREPDTVIELLPMNTQDDEYFQSFIDHYLRCQIRDTFVEMGVHPPAEFQVLGMGRFMAAHGYDYIDFYPEFHNPETTAEAFRNPL